MHYSKHFSILSSIIILFTTTAGAQKYRTLSDTVKLNKEYGELNLDLSKLNTKLITEKNKTASYEDKIKTMTNDAMVSGQKSKDDISSGTVGDVADSKRSMKEAKQANSDARDAQSAREKLKASNKRIEDLQEQINKKQSQISALDSVKLALVSQSIPAVTTQ